MIDIIEASEIHLTTIQQIARITWYDTYSDILSNEQSEYMLEWMYNTESLKDQINNKSNHYLLVWDGKEYMAYAAYELNYEGQTKTKIHKLYILPQHQGKGIGKLLMTKISAIALDNNNKSLLLNMNKQNKAIYFYQKVGFHIIEEKCNDIGNGYVMDDYIFEKSIL